MPQVQSLISVLPFIHAVFECNQAIKQSRSQANYSARGAERPARESVELSTSGSSGPRRFQNNSGRSSVGTD